MVVEGLHQAMLGGKMKLVMGGRVVNSRIPLLSCQGSGRAGGSGSGELGRISEQNWAKQLRKSENWWRGESSLEALLRSVHWIFLIILFKKLKE